jgi:hypothetical protein
MTTITIRAVKHGETNIEVDADAYASAKADGKLDHLLDCDLSDMDTDTQLIEPGGARINPYGPDPEPAESPTTWDGGHALVIEYGDCEIYGRCQCGERLGMVTPDKPLDRFAGPWERHVMGLDH